MMRKKDLDFERMIDDLLYLLDRRENLDGIAMNWVVIETLKPWVGKVSSYGINLESVIDYLSSKECDVDSSKVILVLEDIQSRY